MSKISRLEFISMIGTATAAFAPGLTKALSNRPTKNHKNMYGLIGKISAKTGRRDELIEILIEGTDEMPGCLSYIVSKDSENEDAIWITEVWESRQSHQASLELPAVQEAMRKGKPLIENFGDQIETEPVGGHGLVTTSN